MSDEQRFIPFSVRQGGGDAAKWSVLCEGTPAHLAPSLSGWIYRQTDRRGYGSRIQRELHLDLGDDLADAASIRFHADSDPTLMLDIVDLLLRINSEWVESVKQTQYANSNVQRLRNEVIEDLVVLMHMLAQASSAYAVDMSGLWQLVRRVDPTAEEAVKDVVQRAGHASGLLRASWKSTFSRDPVPDVAYREAVYAVESVACALFTPKDEEPSLGKAINHLAATVDKWSVAGLDDKQQTSSETLLGMLRTVWQNHERHVGKGGTPPQGAIQEEAEAVVFLAVTLVQWFERGLVRRSD